MTDNQSSGNRWEPDATTSETEPIRGGELAGAAAPQGEPQPAEPQPVEAAEGTPSAASGGLRERARRLRGSRPAVVTGAAAVLLAVAAAGFATGWAASPDGDQPGRPGFRGPEGFPGQAPGGQDGDRAFPPAPPGGPYDDDQSDDGQSEGGQSEGGSGTESSWYVVPSSSASVV